MKRFTGKSDENNHHSAAFSHFYYPRYVEMWPSLPSLPLTLYIMHFCFHLPSIVISSVATSSHILPSSLSLQPLTPFQSRLVLPPPPLCSLMSSILTSFIPSPLVNSQMHLFLYFLVIIISPRGSPRSLLFFP